MKKAEITNEKFNGSWELLEWTNESKEGTIGFPFGKDITGQITYGSDGSMSVQIMKKNRPTFRSGDPLDGMAEEMIDAFKGFIAYCGTYEINQDSNQVVHQIRISSFPNWVGKVQVRKFEFNGDRLTLSTDYIGPNKHTLVWRKIVP